MNRKISLGMAIALAAVIAAFAVVITYTAAIRIFDGRMRSVTERQNMYQLLSEIDMTVRQHYDGELSSGYLQRGISEGYIAGMNDPYCAYLSPDEYQLAVNEEQGYSFGFGMEIGRASDGNILVNVVHDGSPAGKAGLKTGDLIVRVGDKDVLAVGYDKAVALIGEASPRVSVTVSRGGQRAAYELTRSKFQTKTVKYRVTGEDIGVITVYGFDAGTPAQFNAALAKLRNSGVKGLVIDLRDNGGVGYEYACEAADTLLPSGPLMSVTGRDGIPVQKYTSDNKYIDLPAQVLVNGSTEGAAELFAAAMLSYGRAETVGTATAGHVTVQELFPLSNGGAVRLTTGRWSDTMEKYLTDGRIQPQFEVMLTAYQTTHRYQLADADDPQLQTAVERIRTAISLREEAEAEENADEAGEETPQTTTTTTTKLPENQTAKAMTSATKKK